MIYALVASIALNAVLVIAWLEARKCRRLWRMTCDAWQRRAEELECLLLGGKQ